MLTATGHEIGATYARYGRTDEHTYTVLSAQTPIRWDGARFVDTWMGETVTVQAPSDGGRTRTHCTRVDRWDTRL